MHIIVKFHNPFRLKCIIISQQTYRIVRLYYIFCVYYLCTLFSITVRTIYISMVICPSALCQDQFLIYSRKLSAWCFAQYTNAYFSQKPYTLRCTTHSDFLGNITYSSWVRYTAFILMYLILGRVCDLYIVRNMQNCFMEKLLLCFFVKTTKL